MTLPVIIYGNPVLRKVSRQIENNEKNLNAFIENMFDTMYNSEGIGLAAPQLDKSVQLFVVDGSPLEKDDPKLKDFKKVFINPKIEEYYGEEIFAEEGCLSIPSIREEVKRPEKITIQYYDQNFDFHRENYEGFIARVIQHEYDHLHGVLFTDKISPLRKRMLRKKLASIAKGKFEVKYKVKLG